MFRTLLYLLIGCTLLISGCSTPTPQPAPTPTAPTFDKELFCTDLTELNNILASREITPNSPLTAQLLVLAQTLTPQLPNEKALFDDFISQITTKTPDNSFTNPVDTYKLQQVLSEAISSTCETITLPPPQDVTDSNISVSCLAESVIVDCSAQHDKEVFSVPSPGSCWAALSPQSLNLAQTLEGPVIDDPRVLESASFAVGDEVRCSVTFFEPQVVQVVR